MDRNFHLTNFDNQISLTKVVKKNIGENNIHVDYNLFNFEKSISNLINLDDRINMILEKYKTKTKIEYDNKNRVIIINILNEIRMFMLDFYVHHDTISKLIKKYRPQRFNKVLSKKSQYSRSVGEIENQYWEPNKYLKSSRCVARIEDQNKLIKSEKESLPQEIIDEKTGIEIKT